MKLWNVSVRESAEQRGGHKRKDGVTKFLVHAETEEGARKIAMDNFRGDIIRKKIIGIRSSEEKGECLWNGYYLREKDDTKGWTEVT